MSKKKKDLDIADLAKALVTFYHKEVEADEPKEWVMKEARQFMKDCAELLYQQRANTLPDTGDQVKLHNLGMTTVDYQFPYAVNGKTADAS